MSKALNIGHGTAYVVTDLHGQLEPYLRYRDHFLSLLDHGRADMLILLGDVIHGYGRPEDDASLDMLLDIMQLQSELGPHRVIMLLGNHELPHIYGVTLSKGAMEFTPRFEAAMGEHRPYIIEFLKTLPFWIRTPSGVLLTHAGAAASVAAPQVAAQMADFSHDMLLREAEALMSREDVLDLIRASMKMSLEEYDWMARYHLAVSGQDDPRYLDLLRGLIVSSLQEWQPLWDFLFNQCEAGLSLSFYRQVLNRYLSAYSSEEWPQRVVVTGHMAVRDGFEIVADQQLRLASWAHATPKDAGCYLLFDVAQPVASARDLISCIHRIP